MAKLLWSDFDWPYERVINWCIRYDEYMNSLAHVNFAFILLQFLCVLDLYACFFCNFLKYFYFDYLHMCDIAHVSSYFILLSSNTFHIG